MIPWELIWQVVFIAILLAFALMSVLVTIFGAKDIGTLVGRLRQSETEAKDLQETKES
jgi:hypothetical protein